jgi:hypothetical protein
MPLLKDTNVAMRPAITSSGIAELSLCSAIMTT